VRKNGGEKMKMPHYPNLRQLMAKYGMTKGDIAEILGITYRQTLSKMNRVKTKKGHAIFSMEEGFKISKFFQNLGEKVTVDYIFFDSVTSNEAEVV
jgi:DNA-binding XRE family transcriptional regulator